MGNHPAHDHRYRITHRITPRLDVRAEAFAYMTSTVGSGVYYCVPVWCGLTLGPSVLVWPAVATTLDGGERAFASPAGKRQVHQAFDLPPFVNVSAVWEL